ncbi:MAG: hypothetical protein K0V04_01360 [Deltaproteobacteria bacterium]|nr:hypothetical protein [Deltaproteobacteria bacterium]
MSWLIHVVMTIVSATWLYNSRAEGVAPATEGVAPTIEAAPPANRPPLVVVRALGPVPSEQVRAACRVLLAEFPVRCVVRASRSVTEVLDSWSPEREQLDARQTLDGLFDDRARDAVVELDLTALDLYEPGKPYVFGLASLPDRTALLSVARLMDGDAETARARLHTLIRHEFGHALGLAHHDVADCVMRQDPTVESLDQAPDGPCVRCAADTDVQLDKLARRGQPALDRARGLLLRGRREDARRTLVEALWSYHPDIALLDDFARVFLEARQYNEAISLLRHTVSRNPGRAAAHVQLGLAYQRRDRDGDLARAVLQFEQAVVLRPDWESVVDHLEATRAEIRAQGPS